MNFSPSVNLSFLGLGEICWGKIEVACSLKLFWIPYKITFRMIYIIWFAACLAMFYAGHLAGTGKIVRKIGFQTSLKINQSYDFF